MNRNSKPWNIKDLSLNGSGPWTNDEWNRIMESWDEAAIVAEYLTQPVGLLLPQADGETIIVERTHIDR